MMLSLLSHAKTVATKKEDSPISPNACQRLSEKERADDRLRE